VLVYFDLEGMSGVTSLAEAGWVRDSAAIGRGRAAATRDVLAVISGLRAAGIDSIGVVDFHGAGEMDDVAATALPAGVTTVPRAVTDTARPGAFDGVLFVGMHTGPHGGGFLAHSFSSGLDPRLNGRSVNETELETARWADVGVPALFVSGDDRLQMELAASMPWIEYVVTKRARDFLTVDTVPTAVVARNLASGARRAVERRAGAQVARVNVPIAVGLRTFGPAALGESLTGLPGLTVVGDETRFLAPDVKAANRAVIAMYRLAGTQFRRTFDRQLQQRSDMRAVADSTWLRFQRAYGAFVDSVAAVQAQRTPRAP
jgi:D-aminopeptidase